MPDRIRDKVMIYTIRINTTYDNNMIMRKRAIENSNFVAHQKLGDQQFSVSELREKIQKGWWFISQQNIYILEPHFEKVHDIGQKGLKNFALLISFKLMEKKGLPAFFSTGSCAEFHFKPLKRLLSLYIKETSGKDVDLSDGSKLYEALQKKHLYCWSLLWYENSKLFSWCYVSSFWCNNILVQTGVCKI